MNAKQTTVTAGHSDLLSTTLQGEVHKEEKITVQDRQYCQEQQDRLYESLDQIDRWYEVFTQEAEQYRESHKLRYKENGKVEHRGGYRSYEECQRDYKDWEFTPFNAINKLVEKNLEANKAFASRIVDYFNRTYSVSVPVPEMDGETLKMGSRPVYGNYVDKVIEHLGGRSFRSTAEDELLNRFLRLVKPSCWSKVKPELKGDKISFPDLMRYDDYYYERYRKCHVHYNYHNELEVLCEGIAFGADDILGGTSGIILRLDKNDVDITGWYDLTTTNATQIRFFKNGRVDVRFKDRLVAQSCFQRLRLDEITLPDNNR